MTDKDALEALALTAEEQLQKRKERIKARLVAPEKLPDYCTDEDFARMTEEAGLEYETIIDWDDKQWRRLVNKHRQDSDRVNTAIKQIMKNTHTTLVSANVRRQSFVVERRFIDKNCKAYRFLPKEVWRQFGLYYDGSNLFYNSNAEKEQLTDEKGADLVAIRFDDPHFSRYASHFEDKVNNLREQFNAYNHFMKDGETKHLIHLTKSLPAAVVTTFQLYYIKFEIDIDYAKSREISDWGDIGQDYEGDDLATRTTNLEVYQNYPEVYQYGTRQMQVYEYIDYLKTKEWEYQRSLQKSGGKDAWALKQLFASDAEEDILKQFFLLDRLIQDFEFREHYNCEQPVAAQD